MAAALLAAALGAQAQEATLRAVTVQGGLTAPQGDIAGFGDLPLSQVPVSATVIERQQIEATGARRLADLTRFDASVSDAYNAPGYWDHLSVRGFTLDNRANYRREGLPISAETAIPLDNKERIDILKGTSGIQAGTSAPGGLVNYVVKRPTQQPLRQVRLEAASRASVLAAADISQRFGAQNAFGLRINAAHERLRPQVHDLNGERSLLAAAADWRISGDAILEGEIEWSHQSQASQAGWSLLGSTLPAPANPRINLNNQPWVQPTVFDAVTGTLRYEHALGPQWRWSAQIGRQSLDSDDYTAFPFGCGAEGNFDRFCSDGTFDYYDFRSENEKRRVDAAQLKLQGQLDTGGIRHDLSLSLLHSRARYQFEPQAFNWVGVGNVQGTAVVPADPSRVVQNTNRDERTTELAVQDALHFNDRLTFWAGLRHTRLARESVSTDGTGRTTYDQSLTTPWLALSYQLTADTMAYGSWGQGVESQVVPNLPMQYSNAGQALPALKSRQLEMGLRGGGGGWAWQIAAFRIERPVSNIDACTRLFITPCLGSNDGQARHRGLETQASWSRGPWRLAGSATVIDAKRRGSTAEPAINGQRPPNVPTHVARALVGWRLPFITDLELQGTVSHEGRRHVLPDGSTRLPAWTTLGAALRYDTRFKGTATRWILAVDNLTDKRYWRESPYQFGHVYLYPGAPRTLRLTLLASM